MRGDHSVLKSHPQHYIQQTFAYGVLRQGGRIVRNITMLLETHIELRYPALVDVKAINHEH